MKTLTPGHKYALDNHESRTDLQKRFITGIAEDGYDLCQLIEACGAGEAQTRAAVAASALLEKLLEIVHGSQVIQFIEKVPKEGGAPGELEVSGYEFLWPHWQNRRYGQ